MKTFSKVFSAELCGIEAQLIEVETDINVGLCSFNIVGLADKALTEAKERVNSALKNSGIKPPNKENKKTTVNLAPADWKKTGSQYDLAIALGYLLSSKQIKPFKTEDKIFVGELSLDGSLRKINGALNFACLAKEKGFKYLFLPKENAKEAAIVNGVNIVPIENLKELIEILEEIRPLKIFKQEKIDFKLNPILDISEIKGQELAKRVLAIVAAGGHNLLMTGPPGVGKTMLAQALTSLLPPLSLEEVIEITKIYSAAGMLKNDFVNFRPFRGPHHSASDVALIGGGNTPRPGEISLAHYGVLFLDELPEFKRNVLEALRQPLENGFVTISRAKQILTFPANFVLVAAMNPCPCGFWGDEDKECKCSAAEINRYQKKISGPLLDRIDLQLKVERINFNELEKEPQSSKELKEKIIKAREIQKNRFQKAGLKIKLNSEMSSKQTEKLINLEPKAKKLLRTILDTQKLSLRSYFRLLKTAQTIADLEEDEIVKENHIAEAFQYRLKNDEF